jgi:hypothetical protein
MFANKIKFVINETVEDKATGKNKYKKIAELDMPIPVLSDFGIQGKLKAANKEDGIDENGKDEDGVPCYEDAPLDWLQYAIVQALKSQNRNKVDGANLKDGMKFPENFEELVAVGERSGEALKARHAAKASLAAYLKGKNKADVVVKLLSDLFVDASSISTCKDDFAEALEFHIKSWVPALNEVDKVRFERTIEKAVEALNGRSATLENLK